MTDFEMREEINLWKHRLIDANNRTIEALSDKVKDLNEILELRTEIVRLREGFYVAADFEVKDQISGNMIRFCDTVTFKMALSKPPEPQC